MAAPAGGPPPPGIAPAGGGAHPRPYDTKVMARTALEETPPLRLRPLEAPPEDEPEPEDVAEVAEVEDDGQEDDDGEPEDEGYSPTTEEAVQL